MGVEPSVEEIPLKITSLPGGLHVVAYRAILDVPAELVAYVAGLLADERRARGTRAGTRAPLSCWGQAVFALVWFRERRPVALVGKGLGISQATSYRYLAEAIDVLAAQAPDLHHALRQVAEAGWSHVVLDARSSTATGWPRPRPARRASSSTPGTPARPTALAATSKPSCAPTVYRSGSATSRLARSTT